MPSTGTNVSPIVVAISGSQQISSAPGNVWSLDVRGTLPDNVATSNTYLYRQIGAFGDQDNPAQDLYDAFFVNLDNPFDKLKLILSDTFAAVCCVIRNLSIPNSFTNVFDITGGGGGALAGEVNSTNSVFRLRYMDVNGDLKKRKSIYIPGIDQSFISNSKLTVGGFNGFNQFVASLYTLQGDLSQWQWSYNDGVDEPQVDAANGHPACFMTRLKSRSPSLC